jgi:glycerophosphoryl diester phosphodiesterase
MRRILRNALLVTAGLGLFVLGNNTSLLVSREPGKPTLLAHRGIAQRYNTDDLQSDTCTAARMLPSNHAFLENTIASLRASFDAGADINEIDVHPTTDGRFAVFHDWTLDCRTNGSGVTREHSMADLKALDIGYGYTADGGRTFPFRGKGIGLMPSLDEVIAAFPDRRFIINVKSRDVSEGEKLASFLKTLSPDQRSRLVVYGGGDAVMGTLKRRQGDVRVMSKRSLRECLIRYIAYGWTGMMPGTCRETIVLVPINAAPWLWGWPNLFLNRFESVGTEVFVIGRYYGEAFSNGLDTAEDLAELPEGYCGGIWTNEIGLVARHFGLGPGE